MFRNIILEKLILPCGDFIFRTNFYKKLKFWRKFDNYSSHDLIDYQNIQLKKQLIYAINNIEKYKHINFLNSESAGELLNKFSILSKDDLRNDFYKLNINSENKTIKIYSSGSTGIRSFVNMDVNDLMSCQALTIHIWELCGYRIGSSAIQTGISLERSKFKKLKDFFFGIVYVSAFALSSKDLNAICKKLLRNKKTTLIGYPSSINIIAEYALENNFDIKIEKYIGLGDAMLPTYKKNIKKAFQCKVLETYGASEGFQIGFQVDLNYLYIFSPQVYLELLDDNNRPVKDGEIGHVVVTRLDNKQMPLIRYKIGDLAIKLPKEKYPNKRKFNFLLLEKVVGRNTDIILLPDNRKLVVHSFTGVFEHIEEIKQFKVIQKNNKGITIECVPSENTIQLPIEKIKNKLQEFILNENFLICIEKVTEIKSSKSGKVQIIESLL
jgi:phenylacetate-CoA ligase